MGEMMSESSLEKAKLLSILKHDMNNVLTGVKTGLEIMAMDEFFEEDDNAEDLNDVKNASIRMANMLEDLSLLYGDQEELRPPTQREVFSELQSKISAQLGLEGIAVTWEQVPTDSTEVVTHADSLVRGIFYGALLLNELEKGSVSLKVNAFGDGLSWSFSLSSSTEAALSNLSNNVPDGGRPNFLLKMAKLASKRLGAKWTVGEGSFSLNPGVGN